MSELLQFPAPNNKRELFERLRAILREGQFEMPTEPRYNGTGAPGCYLEDLLGLRVGNQDIADVAGWEVKFYTPQTSLITLFHKEPDSRTVMRYLVSTYGWMDGQGRLSFRHTVKGQSDRFIVVNDAGNIIVRPLDGTDGPVPIWSHDTLLGALGGKLRRLILVSGQRVGRKVKYNSVHCYENLQITSLINKIAEGKIAIDFDARQARPGSRGLRNHGTKFRVAPADIGSLYVNNEPLN